MKWSDYFYPGSDVLINKLDIRDNEILYFYERRLTFARLSKLEANPIEGQFDLDHLKNIHKYIFQDVYDWAGDLRKVDMGKGSSEFTLIKDIEPLAKDIFDKLKNENFLKELDINFFCDRLAYYSGQINIIHPFREGNGRSTREFIRCLADQAGYSINYGQVNKEELFEAYIRSFYNDYNGLKKVYRDHIVDSIKQCYLDEFPGIKKASMTLLENLNKLRLIQPEFKTFKKEFIPVIEIKRIYEKYGKLIDSEGPNPEVITEYNGRFKLVSDIMQEVRTLQIKDLNLDSSRELNQGQNMKSKIDLEIE